MKDSAKKSYIVTFTVGALLTVLAVILRMLLLLFHFDTSVRHFEDIPLANIAFPTVLILASFLFVAFGVLKRSELRDNTLNTSLPGAFASAFCAIAALVYAVTEISDIINCTDSLARIFGTLMLICSLGLILYFIFGAIGTVPVFLRALCGIFTIFFCVFYILYSYFDMSLMLNDPNRVLDQITFLSLVLFFLVECRFFFGTARYTVYLPLAMLAMLFCAVSSIPALIYGAMHDVSLSGSTTHDFMVFALFVYAVVQLFTAAYSGKKEEVKSAYANEIATDVVGSAVSGIHDPDQQVFDFGSESKQQTEETVQEDDGDYETDAQTTLDFKRKTNR